VNAEKLHRLNRQTQRERVFEEATKALCNHLQFRRLFRFDDETPEWTENPLLKHKLLPMGALAPADDTHDLIAWYTEYRSLRFEVGELINV
jgi:hypothetical protein